MKYLFFTLLLLFYLSLNSYLFYKGWLLMPPNSRVKTIYTLLFWLIALLFVARMLFGDLLPTSLAKTLSDIAFSWLILLIYLSLISLLFSLLLSLTPSALLPNFLKSGAVRALLSLLFVAALLLWGNYNFNNPKIVRLTLKLEKPLPPQGVRIALISDLHLSSSIEREHLKKFVELINRERVNLLLIAGDIVDRELQPLIEFDAASLFREVESSHGIYAISGNHEFYGGERERVIEYLKEGGINFLIDSAVTIEGLVHLIGREDRSNPKRRELSHLMESLEGELTTILLDHQPYNLEEAVESGVDLQLSGHTHNGQFWPGNIIVKWLFEVAYGYKKIGESHFYVTSGLGIWGPKYRIGTSSEIVVIDLEN